MAIHDLWAFDNAPQNTDFSSTTVPNATVQNTYNALTGNPGGAFKVGQSTMEVTSDGYLTIAANASVAGMGALQIGVNQVQDWAVATQYWFGFRTMAKNLKLTGGYGILSVADAQSPTVTEGILTEAILTNAGYGALNEADYIEVNFNRSTGAIVIYANGVSVRSFALSAPFLASTMIWYFGPRTTAPANAARGFRDFYWLDVDSVDTTRLGPVASSLASISSVSGAGWTLNSAANLLAAVRTPITGTGQTTPSTTSPSTNQPLAASLITSLSSNANILALQPQMSLGGATAASTSATLDLVQNGTTLGIGTPVLSNGAMMYNYRHAGIIERYAPDGTIWTPAKINSTQLTVTPN